MLDTYAKLYTNFGDEDISPRNVSKKLKLTYESSRVILNRLKELGLIHQKTRGIYHLTDIKKWLGLTRVLNDEVVLSKFVGIFKCDTDKIEAVLLYGSRARGEAKKDSDWDLLIISKNPQQLEAKFGKNIGIFEIKYATKKYFTNKIKQSKLSLFDYMIFKEGRIAFDDFLKKKVIEAGVNKNEAKNEIKFAIDWLKTDINYLQVTELNRSMLLCYRTAYIARCFIENKSYSARKMEEDFKGLERSPKRVLKYAEEVLAAW